MLATFNELAEAELNDAIGYYETEQVAGIESSVRTIRLRSRGGQLCNTKLLAASFHVPEVVLGLLVQPALGRRAEGDR